MGRKALTPEEIALRQQSRQSEKSQSEKTEDQDNKAPEDVVILPSPNDEALKEIEELKRQLAEAKKAPEKQQPAQVIQPVYSLAESKARAQAEMLAKRKEAVLSGNIPTVTGNKDADYSFPEWESHLVHYRVAKYPADNGNRKLEMKDGRMQQVVDVPLQSKKSTVNAYADLEKSQLLSKGYLSVQILHDPRQK